MIKDILKKYTHTQKKQQPTNMQFKAIEKQTNKKTDMYNSNV